MNAPATATQPQPRGLALADLARIPARLSLPSAGRYFGLSRGNSYALHARGEFPVPTHKIGERLVVLGADVVRALGLDPEQLVAVSTPPAAAEPADAA